MLCCAVRCCAVLCYAVLCYAMLCCAAWNCTVHGSTFRVAALPQAVASCDGDVVHKADRRGQHWQGARGVERVGGGGGVAGILATVEVTVARFKRSCIYAQALTKPVKLRYISTIQHRNHVLATTGVHRVMVQQSQTLTKTMAMSSSGAGLSR